MKKLYFSQGNNPTWMLSLTLLIYMSFLVFACASAKQQSKSKTSIPPDHSIPLSTSEIREIKYSKGDAEHGDLHLSGQLFTKRRVRDSIQLRPCANCNILFKLANDSTTFGNIKTESDGQFTIEVQKNTYSLLLNNPGLNKIEINNIDLGAGGNNNIIIVNARGNKVEKFAVSKNGSEYTWTHNIQPQ